MQPDSQLQSDAQLGHFQLIEILNSGVSFRAVPGIQLKDLHNDGQTTPYRRVERECFE